VDNIEIHTAALITALTATVFVGTRVVLKVQEAAPIEGEWGAPVVDGRRPWATAGLAVLLAIGVAAPLYLLATVWGGLKPI